MNKIILLSILMITFVNISQCNEPVPVPTPSPVATETPLLTNQL